MSWENLLAFNLVLAVALASPGAAFLMALKTALTAGRSAGIALGFGLATMAALWTLCALLGLETIFALFPWTYTTLKLAGAAYLIYLAIQTWRFARSELKDAPPRPHSRAFLSGFLVNLANPKSMLFAAAVILVVFPPNLSSGEIAIITVYHFTVEAIFYAAFSTLITTARAKATYMSLKPILDRIAATLLGALGLRLLLEK